VTVAAVSTSAYLHVYMSQMSQEAMLDSLEQELKETEFNGEQTLGCLTFIFCAE